MNKKRGKGKKMAVTIEQLLHNNKREEADRKEENL